MNCERCKELEEALSKLVDLYVQNRGNGAGEFISCITPRCASEMTVLERISDRVWSAWDRARVLLGE